MLQEFVTPHYHQALQKISENIQDAENVSPWMILGGTILGLGAAAQGLIPPFLFLGTGLVLISLAGFVTKNGEETRIPFFTLFLPPFIIGVYLFLYATASGQGLGGAFALLSFFALIFFEMVAVLKDKIPVLQDTPFYHAGRIIEWPEVILYLLMINIMPEAFSSLAFVFGLLCWVTIGGKIYRLFRG